MQPACYKKANEEKEEGKKKKKTRAKKLEQKEERINYRQGFSFDRNTML